MATLFDDVDISIELLGMAVWDKAWLRAVGDIISQDDFKPLSKNTSSIAWVLAGIAIDFYLKNRTPLGSLVKEEMKKWAADSGASAARKDEIVKFLKRLRKSYDPARSEILRDKVRDFKRTKKRQQAIRELAELETTNQLTDDKFAEITRAVMESTVDNEEISNYHEELEDRFIRRVSWARKRTPIFMIDPLDHQIQSISRGQMGLWLAYYKMGKSLALIHNAVSYLAQNLNVLFLTLEDPKADVEDRFDAHITEMQTEDLGIEREEVATRFSRFRDRFRSGLRIVDGTDGRITVPAIEAIYERQRAQNFDADAIIVDYDDEIRPTTKRLERRQEFADIYRDLRKLAARKNVMLWTAAQANRAAEGKEVITGSYTAEDISKIRKVTFAGGIGQGEWGQESRCITVIAHKNDKAKFSVTIWSSPEKGTFYDREKTLEEIAKRRGNAAGR